jgi:hypothetical protein
MANASDGVNSRNRRFSVVSALTCAVLCGSGAAEAHPEWSPIRVNRYCKLVLEGPARIRLVYTLLFGEGPALPGRKGVDLDANGRIDDREKHLLGKRAQSIVEAGLRLTLDGAPVPIGSLGSSGSSGSLGSLGAPGIEVGLVGDAVAPEPYSVDLSYAIELGDRPGPRELGIDDHVEVPSEGDTEVSIEETPGLRYLGAFRGRRPSVEAPLEKQRLFTFRGPRFSVLEDRRVTVRVEVMPRRDRLTLLLALVGLGLVVSFGVAALRWRARRARCV